MQLCSSDQLETSKIFLCGSFSRIASFSLLHVTLGGWLTLEGSWTRKRAACHRPRLAHFESLSTLDTFDLLAANKGARSALPEEFQRCAFSFCVQYFSKFAELEQSLCSGGRLSTELNALLARTAMMLGRCQIRLMVSTLLFLATFVAVSHCLEPSTPALSVESNLHLALEQHYGAPVQLKGERNSAADYVESLTDRALLRASVATDFPSGLPLRLLLLQDDTVISQLVSLVACYSRRPLRLMLILPLLPVSSALTGPKRLAKFHCGKLAICGPRDGRLPCGMSAAYAHRQTLMLFPVEH